MILALTTVGVSASQLLAPEGQKPSDFFSQKSENQESQTENKEVDKKTRVN